MKVIGRMYGDARPKHLPLGLGSVSFLRGLAVERAAELRLHQGTERIDDDWMVGFGE